MARIWLPRILVATVAGIMVISFIMPWWSANISVMPVEDAIRIYAHGLKHEMVQLAQYIAADETPLYQTVLAFIYLGVSVGLILLSTWLKGRKCSWLLGGVGLIYIVYAALAVIWIAIRSGDFGVSLQGFSIIIIEERGMNIGVDTSLRFGYYLAYVAGIMCIALALFHDKICLKRGL